MNGTVVATFVEHGEVCLAVRVAEANGENVEYIGRVPNNAAFKALPPAQKKAALVAAVKAARDRQVQVVGDTAPAMSGIVTV